MPDLDISKLTQVLENLELLIVILQNNPSHKEEYTLKCCELIRHLMTRIQCFKTLRSNYHLEEEEAMIRQLELDRLKQELAMRSQSAAVAQDERMADYRHRARDLVANEDAIRNQPIGLPNPFAGQDMEESDPEENEDYVSHFKVFSISQLFFARRLIAK